MPDLQASMRYLGNYESRGPRSQFPDDEQAVLDRVNQKVAAAASLADLMDFLFEAVQELYPCDRMGLAFLEDGGRRIVSHWTKATYEPLTLKVGYAEDLSGSSLKRVLDEGASRIIYDLARYEEEHPRSASTRILVREGVRSSLTCPLLLEGTPFGVIFLSSREERVYTPYHGRLWRAIAERISQAVEKTWRIEQLLAANQAYNEMLGFVSHELKNPVASMITDARVLAQGYLGELDPNQVRKLERLISKGEYLLDLVREYLDLARMEGGKLTLKPAPCKLVEELIEPSIELVNAQIQEQNVTLVRHYPDYTLPAECDPALLKIVLVNLLGNAVKYGNPDGHIEIKLEQHHDHFIISVWNAGPGFPEEERPKLFRRFSRLQTPELLARKGTGVGLYTAWRVANLHGGRMSARSECGKWAEFSLEIPQPLPQGN
nr:GAF domain-containing sensor histidine kinase [uncultured Holophaga sp.]